MAALSGSRPGVDSGIRGDMRFGHAIRVRKGVAVEFVTRRTAEEAREALPSRLSRQART